MSLKFFAAATALALATATSLAAVSDDQRTNYIVQLGDAPASMYLGGVSGLAATRPRVGARFDANSSTTQAYVAYLDQQRNEVIARAGRIIVRARYSHAFNGFSASLTPDQASRLTGLANVVSVTPVRLEQPVTVSTPDFLGLTGSGGLWSRLDSGSRLIKGEDVIVGVIDTGIWPEDPAFSDKVDASGRPVAYNQTGTVAYGAAPAKWRGRCQVGQGFTAQLCNNKLIGARYYADFFLKNGIGLAASEYLSPRDGNGHGSHTASTAAGNGPVEAIANGQSLGGMSGIAPRARIAVYKTCFTSDDPVNTGCPTDGIVAAIDDAVADGVDVINFSITGSREIVPDAVELAFLGAASAGVFVATAAGNSGPGAATVNHPWPWTTTVAASTHDRSYLADLALGNGASVTGAAYPSVSGLPSAALVAAINAGVQPYETLSAANRAALAQCFMPADRDAIGATADSALDPNKTAGKLVVCQRGGNPLVNKGGAVAAAGAVGLVILNTPISADNTFVLQQPVPAVHLKAASFATVWPYAIAQGDPTASISPTRSVRGLDPAPVMASFSSAGPNWAVADTLKPDITAPGVGVLAAFAPTLTAQQRDLVILGSLVPPAANEFLDGTSMSTPHVAGTAALLKQLRPGWTPAAIKSALMTSASGVLLDSGATDPNRFRYGSGHLNPTAAADAGLVYDLAPLDYIKFLCGIGFAAPAPYQSCSSAGNIRSANLNLASLTLSVGGTGSMTRTVTNTGNATATFVASTSLPGWTVNVQPSSLTLAPGQRGSFTVTVTAAGVTGGDWSYGELIWTNGPQKIRSPLTVRNLSVLAPLQISDTAPQNVRLFTVSSSARPIPNARGLILPSVRTGKLAPGNRQCFDFTTYTTTTAFRAQLRNDETSGGAATDLSLSVLRNGTTIASSQGPGSDEVITMFRPATGAVHSICVTNVSSGSLSSVDFKLNFWQIAPGAAPQNMVVYNSPVYAANTPTTIGASWSLGSSARGHYLGMVEFIEPSGVILGATMVSVEVP